MNILIKKKITLVLSIAYETLSNPSSKLMYDVSKHKGTARTSASFVSPDDDASPNDTLQRVLHQVCKYNIYFSLNTNTKHTTYSFSTPLVI